MKNTAAFFISLSLICLLALACQFKAGGDTEPKTEKSTDSEKTEKTEKSDKTEKKTSKSDEDRIAQNKETAPDAQSNALSGSERPSGESKSVSNALGTDKTSAASNGNWLYVYDSRKGYGFYVPPGTTGDWGKTSGVDTFAGFTPNKVGIYVFAWKDRSATRETLLNSAKNILEAMGETIKTGNVLGSSDNYVVVEATSVDKQGVNSKMRILVGTDVTDKYVMIVGCDEKEFDKKKETVDAIWGSFEMWSGRS
ncbi:MAG: hypothetical protein K1X72_25185 [Pyrinomonadaceae bacterium]|nr:hypothetical protein [Pyrinomonadaceae bacterium]